jgi:hypothetical protein
VSYNFFCTLIGLTALSIKSTILCDKTPYSRVVIYSSFRSASVSKIKLRKRVSNNHEAVVSVCCLHVSYSAYSLTLKMEAVSSSETSKNFLQSSTIFLVLLPRRLAEVH